MNDLVTLLPQPANDQIAKLATDALAARGFDRASIRYEVADFQLRVDGHRIWLGNLQAQCRLVWPWPAERRRPRIPRLGARQA